MCNEPSNYALKYKIFTFQILAFGVSLGQVHKQVQQVLMLLINNHDYRHRELLYAISVLIVLELDFVHVSYKHNYDGYILVGLWTRVSYT